MLHVTPAVSESVCHKTVGAGYPLAAAVKVKLEVDAPDQLTGFKVITGAAGVVDGAAYANVQTISEAAVVVTDRLFTSIGEAE